MPADSRSRVTGMASAPGGDAAGASAPAEELVPLLYDELRRLAAAVMAREHVGHTLQPTALVHEAYLKLAGQARANFTGRTHFLAVGAQVMRRLLIDHARKRGAKKRGLGWQRVTLGGLHDIAIVAELDAEDLLEIDAALTRLAELDARQARIVTLRFFGGLTAEETALALGVSTRTVESDWRHARAWLQVELTRGATP